MRWTGNRPCITGLFHDETPSPPVDRPAIFPSYYLRGVRIAPPDNPDEKDPTCFSIRFVFNGTELPSAVISFGFGRRASTTEQIRRPGTDKLSSRRAGGATKPPFSLRIATKHNSSPWNSPILCRSTAFLALRSISEKRPNSACREIPAIALLTTEPELPLS